MHTFTTTEVNESGNQVEDSTDTEVFDDDDNDDIENDTEKSRKAEICHIRFSMYTGRLQS